MMFNRTFFRNALSFIAILAIGFIVLFAAEYFFVGWGSSGGVDDVDVYSDCVTNTGEPC